MFFKFIITVITLFYISLGFSISQTELKIREVAVNLDTPWEILWGPDGFIWMTERYGRISRVNPETGELTEFARINEVIEGSEQGLMGMVLHPDFISNKPEVDAMPYVYIIYNYRKNNQSVIKLVRLTDKNGTIESQTILDDIPGAANHDGARLWINKEDLTLYITTGDATIPERAQDIKSLNGKILRMNLDGSIPEDNPFPSSYVWSWGHRNPQGLVYANGKLYSSEHGPDTDDELNVILKNRNYGWPNVKGFCNTPDEKTFCEANSVVEPIAAWTPTLAVAGIDYYNHDLIPEWKNSILVTTLKASRLVQVKLDETGDKAVAQNEYFSGVYGRLRDICVAPDGRVFIATSNKDGRGSPRQQDDKIIEISAKTTGINENIKKNDLIRFFPNPFSERIAFFNHSNHSNSKIEIYNFLGQFVKEINLSNLQETWDGTDFQNNLLPPGIYNCKLMNDSVLETFSIIKY